MNTQEFEVYYRNSIDTVLNLLQTINLLASRIQLQSAEGDDRLDQPSLSLIAQDIETRSLQVGTLVQDLSLVIEEFLQGQR